MCEIYKSFDFSELDKESYFYAQLSEYYEHEMDKDKFPKFSSFLDFNKKLPVPFSRTNTADIASQSSLDFDLKCIVAKGVPRNMTIDGERMSVKNIDLYKRVLDAENKNDAVIDGTFKCINNQNFTISTIEQTKTLMTCTDNKRWICDDNIHTLVFGHYKLPDKHKKDKLNMGWIWECVQFWQNK